MVQGIAIDVASRGITVNNIQPGPTVTEMAVDHIEANGRFVQTRTLSAATRL